MPTTDDGQRPFDDALARALPDTRQCLSSLSKVLEGCRRALAGDAGRGDPRVAVEQAIDDFVAGHTRVIEAVRATSPKIDGVRMGIRPPGGDRHAFLIDGPVLAAITPPVEPYFRLQVALVHLVTLVGVLLDEDLEHEEQGWHRYLFTPETFAHVEFAPLPDGIPARGARRMLPDVLAELLAAARDLTTDDLTFDAMTSIAANATRLLRELDAPVDLDELPGGLRREGDLDSTTQAAEELGIPEADLDQRLRERTLVGVETWSGETMVPSFQYENGNVHPLVSRLLASMDPQIDGWELAIWLRMVLDKYEPDLVLDDDHDLVRALRQRQQWIPSWQEVPTDPPRPPDQTETIDGGTPLYRLTRDDLGPFWFACFEPAGRQNGGGETPPPRGRFDLLKESGNGTCYLTTAVEGACHETIDRQLTPTLQTLARTMVWTLRPQQDLMLLDARDVDDLHIDPRRLATQGFADAVRNDNHRGLVHRLRTGDHGEGVAVFGTAGVTLPASNEHGPWAASSRPLLETEAFWDYVDERDADPERVDVVFRWFPGHVRASLV